MDANAARGYLAFGLPLHFASALSILSLVVVWFCGVCSRFGVGSSGAVLDAFLRPPGNIAAPGRLVHDLYTTALPGASLRVVRWWWPLCVTASGLTAAMPIMATAFQGGATPLLVSDATLTILWALNICLFRLIMKRVDEAATPEALLPVRANAAAH